MKTDYKPPKLRSDWQAAKTKAITRVEPELVDQLDGFTVEPWDRHERHVDSLDETLRAIGNEAPAKIASAVIRYEIAIHVINFLAWFAKIAVVCGILAAAIYWIGRH